MSLSQLQQPHHDCDTEDHQLSGGQARTDGTSSTCFYTSAAIDTNSADGDIEVPGIEHADIQYRSVPIIATT
jgi:hypothetical protein